MTEDEFAPVTPGEMLKEEFLAESRLSQSRLAKLSASRPTELPKSSTIDGASPRTQLCGWPSISAPLRSSG
jgi:hypothetical protein